jgi:hypothetical protein
VSNECGYVGDETRIMSLILTQTVSQPGPLQFITVSPLSTSVCNTTTPHTQLFSSIALFLRIRPVLEISVGFSSVVTAGVASVVVTTNLALNGSHPCGSTMELRFGDIESVAMSSVRFIAAASSMARMPSRGIGAP